MSSMETSAPLEVVMGTGSTTGVAPSVTISSDWNKDLAAMAAEAAPQATPAQPPVVSQPAQAVVTPPAVPPVTVTAPQAVVPPVAAIVPPVEVPEKFRGVDGKLDQEKLLKSYGEAEKALGRALSARQAPAAVATQAPVDPAPAAQQTGNLSPLELQVARDIYASLINSGAGYTPAQAEATAVATARTQVRLAEASGAMAREAALVDVAQLREAHAAQQRNAELQNLSKNYPEVLTPKGFEELVKVREENPWINNSPEPWKAAAQLLVGQKGLNGQAGLVNIPTPTGVQQQAQPLPVTPISPAPNPVALNTPEQIKAHVSSLSKEQEAEFWGKMGLKWELPKSFKGI